MSNDIDVIKSKWAVMWTGTRPPLTDEDLEALQNALNVEFELRRAARGGPCKWCGGTQRDPMFPSCPCPDNCKNGVSRGP